MDRDRDRHDHDRHDSDRRGAAGVAARTGRASGARVPSTASHGPCRRRRRRGGIGEVGNQRQVQVEDAPDDVGAQSTGRPRGKRRPVGARASQRELQTVGAPHVGDDHGGAHHERDDWIISASRVMGRRHSAWVSRRMRRQRPRVADADEEHEVGEVEPQLTWLFSPVTARPCARPAQITRRCPTPPRGRAPPRGVALARPKPPVDRGFGVLEQARRPSSTDASLRQHHLGVLAVAGQAPDPRACAEPFVEAEGVALAQQRTPEPSRVRS